MHLVIPMSGVGKRFVEAGYTDPKPLIEVDGKPMIEHIIGCFPGVDKVSFICNDLHLRTTKMREILTRIRPQATIYEVPVGSKRGPVEVVLSIASDVDDDEEVIVSYCDYSKVWDFAAFKIDCRADNLDGSIPCYIGFHPHMVGPDHYAYCKTENGLVTKIQEKKPFTDDKMSEYASCGSYYFKKGSYVKKYFQQLVDSNVTVNNEFYVSMVYNHMVQDGLKVGVFEIQKMLQWGVPSDLQACQKWSNYFNSPKEDKTAACPPNTTLILPMAGRGSRFEMEDYKVPKPLIPVNGTRMVKAAVDDLPECGKKIFGVAAQHLELGVADFLKDWYLSCGIVSFAQTTKGQACTCEQMIKKAGINLEDPILISACDNGIKYDQNKLNQLFNDYHNDVIVFSFRNNPTTKYKPNSYAYLIVDENDFISDVSCKKLPPNADPMKTSAIIGTMFFRKAKYFLDGLKRNYEMNFTTNSEFYVDGVLNRNVEAGLNVKNFEVEHYLCWGDPDSLKTYNYWQEYFAKL